jgi:hypothetical protein
VFTLEKSLVKSSSQAKGLPKTPYLSARNRDGLGVFALQHDVGLAAITAQLRHALQIDDEAAMHADEL